MNKNPIRITVSNDVMPILIFVDSDNNDEEKIVKALCDTLNKEVCGIDVRIIEGSEDFKNPHLILTRESESKIESVVSILKLIYGGDAVECYAKVGK